MRNKKIIIKIGIGVLFIILGVAAYVVRAETEALLPEEYSTANGWAEASIESILESDSEYVYTVETEKILAVDLTDSQNCDSEIASITINAETYASKKGQNVLLGVGGFSEEDMFGELEEPTNKENEFSLHSLKLKEKAVGEPWKCEDLGALVLLVKSVGEANEGDEWRVNKAWVEVGYTNKEAVINQRSYRWQYTPEVVEEGLVPDMPLGKVEVGEQLALRVQMDNTGGFEIADMSFALQFAEKQGNHCHKLEDWQNVSGSSAISFSKSQKTNILTPGTNTEKSCGDGECEGFIDGVWGSENHSVDLLGNHFTELGYTLDTSNASPGIAYCLRLEGLSGEYYSYPEVSFRNKPVHSFVKELRVNKLPKIKADKDAYLATEAPRFELDYFETTDVTEPYSEGVIESSGVFEKDKFKILASVYDGSGNRVSLMPKITFVPDGHTFIELPVQTSLKPGKYTLELSVSEQDYATFPLAQDFTWGVLAINTNKPAYLPGETVKFGMTVLDDEGKTVCDAKVSLEITAPTGKKYNFSNQNGTIINSDDCGPSNVTYIPDFSAELRKVSEVGEYQMKITATTQNGVRSLTDKFNVEESLDFEIERIAPVRIYPPADYEMKIRIKPDIDFAGEVTEFVPDGFLVTGEGISQTSSGSTKTLTWLVDWKAGETYELQYTFDAPDISPEFYLLGPLEIGEFKEARQWQIASDATDYIDPDGDGTTECTPTPPGSNYTTVDESIRQPSTPTTADYVTCGSNGDDYYQMETIGGASSTSQVVVWVYHVEGSSNMQIDVSLWDATELVQYGSTQRLTNSTTDTWGSGTISGLTLSQAQLDGLRIRHECEKTGGGGPTNCIVYEVYGFVTYSGNQAPNSPTALAQKKTDDTVIVVADWTDETSVKFTATVSDPDNPDTLYLCIEADQLGTAFSNTEDSCGSGVSYVGTPLEATHTLTGLIQGQEYHWQARVKDAANDYSSWVSYESNTESERDFGIDNTGPAVGTVYDGGTMGSDADENAGSLTVVESNWSGFTDAQSGIKKWQHAVGTTAGGTDIVNWKDKAEPGNVFSDEFESADLSAWDATSIDVDDLFASTDSAYVGLYGLEANIDDANTIYVEDDFAAAGDYYVRFYLNPNSLTMASGDEFTIVDVTSSATIRASVEMNYDGANHRVRGVLETGPQTTSWVNVGSAAWSSIELRWFANASGYVSLWVDGVQYDTATGDTSGLTVDNTQMGMISDRDAGTTGAFYFDSYTSDNASYCGPLTYFTETISTAGHLHTGQDYFTAVRGINNAETTGSSGNSDGIVVLPTLSFSVDSHTVTFNELNPVNSWTDSTQSTTTTVSTNAYNGYITTMWSTQAFTNTSYGSKTIINYPSSNGSPSVWSGTGFGYTTSDDNLSGGTADRFTSGGPKYAGFASAGEGDPVCDHTTQVTGQTGAISSEQFTITYRVTVTSAQVAGPYETEIIYITTPTF